MYIKSAEITNIRSIEDFEINFENPAGWHVLIGDNGSGKSTIIRSIALALVGPDEAPGLRADWRDWLSNNKGDGKIELQIEPSDIDKYTGRLAYPEIPNVIRFKRKENAVSLYSNKSKKSLSTAQAIALGYVPSLGTPISKIIHNWGNGYGWFSAAYGPYRRFTGGDTELDVIYNNLPKLGAHLSALNEAAALTEVTKWLIQLSYNEVEQIIESISKEGFDFISKSEWNKHFTPENFVEKYLDSKNLSTNSILYSLRRLINSTKFLPNNTTLEKISSEGVLFKDGNGSLITVNQLSDGYRSILSLTFELIRQLIRVYGKEPVFQNIREDDMRITLPGVVLIDEIDAHLHPTWQTKIGQWFLKYFPNIQFIVTTHSPLVCRAAENGTIWKLAAPGSSEKSEQVTGVDRQRLIFGNILDAYGTEVFGEDVSRSEKSAEMLKELAALSVKSFKGKITHSERKRADQLKQILPTE